MMFIRSVCKDQFDPVIFKTLSEFSALRHLSLQSNNISETDNLVMHFRHQEPMLAIVNLSHNALAKNSFIRIEHSIKYKPIELHFLSALRILSLQYNSIGDTGCQCISGLMKTCKDLVYLDVSYNSIRDTGFAYLFDSLGKKVEFFYGVGNK